MILQRFAMMTAFAVSLSTAAAAASGPGWHPKDPRILVVAATPSDLSTQCRTADVVWVNHKSGLFYEKGQRMYGRTSVGGFACRKNAKAHGMHVASNR